MNDKILFSLSTDTLALPQTLGLTDAILSDSQICCATTAAQTRRLASTIGQGGSVYVIGCDDMEPINLAAAIIFDNPALDTFLVTDQLTGSLSTRAQAAGIRAVMTFEELKNLFDSKCSHNENSQAQILPEGSEPSDDIQLFEDEISAIDDKTSVNPVALQNKSNCWIMSVYSGSGGVGKSTISAMSANLLSALNKRVLMIDCDLQFGDLDYIGGAIDVIEFEAIAKDAKVLSRLNKTNDNNIPSLIKSPSRLENSELASKSILTAIEKAAELFDAIIVNTGSYWSEVNATLLEISNCNLFILDQRISTVRSCQHALELASRMNIATHSFAFALNNCTRKSMLKGLDVMGAINASTVFEIKDGGDKVEQYLSAGRIRELLGEQSEMCMSVFTMLTQLCPLCECDPENKRRKKSRHFL